MDLESHDKQLKDGLDAAWRHLPPRLRVLYITGYQRTSGWLAESLVSESGSDVLLEESVGAAAGLSRLRDEVFDVVLAGHDADDLDALSLVAGIRAGGSDEPIVVLGAPAEQAVAAEFYQEGADAYLCVATTTTRVLVWTVARAVQRTVLVRENRRLVEAERQRLAAEHQEADRLLGQQRALIGDLEAALSRAATENDVPNADAQQPTSPTASGCRLPRTLVDHYRELLRAYVIMGSGNLTEEMQSLAEALATTGVSAHQAMWMHLEVLEDMVRTLGSRSARHVIARADLLALEVMVHLAEGYRRRPRGHGAAPRQILLPGFGTFKDRAAA